MAYEEYTDDELMQMAGEKPATGDASDYSDEELMTIANEGKPPAAAEPPGLLSRTATNIGKAYKEITTPVESEGGLTDLVPRIGEKIIRATGHVGAAAGDIMMTGAKAAYKYGVDPLTQKSISDTADYLGSTDIVKAQGATFKGLKDAYGKLATEYPRVAQDVEAGLNALNLIPAPQLVRGAAPIMKTLGKEGIELAGEGATATKNAFFPKPNPDEAMRQILQSKGKVPGIIERDVEKGWKALSAVDTTGDKVFTDTVGKIDKAIPELAKQVDDVLLKDPTVYPLDDLATVQKTKGGAEVSSNYVKTALDNLEELYTKVEDPVKAGNIGELRAKAETEGLTKKEVNDLARTYGSEYKAFNKATGEPLTSVSAEAYENVRTGLKDVARRGLDDTAKEMDSTMSSLFNTKRLLEQNASASMKLQQRYSERGLGDKIGGVVLDAINFATAGGIKGLMRKAFPSNVGLKVRNAAEIEGKLARNLKIINKELERLDKVKPVGLINPETEIGRGPLSKKNMTPTKGMTFREARALFKKHK